MADHYFSEVASFQQAKEQTKRFAISVTLVSGGTVSSSTFYPIEHLDNILAAIESVDSDGMFFLWNKEEQTLHSILKQSIRSIGIRFA